MRKTVCVTGLMTLLLTVETAEYVQQHQSEYNARTQDQRSPDKVYVQVHPSNDTALNAVPASKISTREEPTGEVVEDQMYMSRIAIPQINRTMENSQQQWMGALPNKSQRVRELILRGADQGTWLILISCGR